MTNELKNIVFKNKLELLGIPYKEINVFGFSRCNIHVKVIGKDTAEKWVRVLSKFCKKVKMIKTTFENETNENSIMNPTRHDGFLIGAMI